MRIIGTYAPIFKTLNICIQGYQLNGIYAPGEEPLFENVGTSIIFKLPNGPGTLASALKCLEGIDLMHIESKPDNRGSFEFYAETGKNFI